jgi:cytochrome c-type biogenesis protein CcmH/NrfG
VATLLIQNEAIQSTEIFSLPVRFVTALLACKVYLLQMVYPAGLAVFYPFPHKGLSVWQGAMDGTLLVAISAVAWGERRTRPWLLMGWVWYVVMLLPVTGIIQVGGQAHADRYTYLPQIGIYVAVTWLVAEWRVGRVALGGLMAGVLAVLMVCAWQQTAYWQNSETLWTHALACTTDNQVSHFNLGNALRFEGRMDEAIPQYQKALEINPNYAEAHLNLGMALFQKGRTDEAITHLQRAAQLKPGNAILIYNLGVAFQQKGRVDEAIACYQKALATNPGYAPARNNLEKAVLQKQRPDVKY